MLAVALSSCGPLVPDHGSGAEAAFATLSFEPGADPSAVPSVVRIHIPSTRLSSGDVSLFEGALSDYYLSKVKHGEVPDALAVRQVGLVSWRTETELVIAPLAPLPLGPYSLAARVGLVAEFQVVSEAPLLRRVWPPSGAGASPRFAVYCGGTAPTPSTDPFVLEPSALSARVSSGVDADGAFAERCLHLSSDADLDFDQIALPPLMVGDSALDPALFSQATSPPALPLGCADGELALGVGCALIADDRAMVRTPSAALLWIVHTEHGAFVEVTRDGASFVIRGLSPSRHEHLWGSVYDESGAGLAFDSFADTAPARARPVLNEVLANPLGPEPQAEWIELVNDGSLAFDLSTFTLQDGGGSTSLPQAQIAPQEYVLLVREDFAPNASDVPPAAGTRLIRMPTLGKSGLSNGGERLALLDAAGQACSVVPALPTKAGQSLARRYPWSLDADPGAFSYGAPTPGAVNGPPTSE
jgi:hypothetical protein